MVKSDFAACGRKGIIQRLLNLSAKKARLLIICHQNPDGDTVGSAFALKLIYEALGGYAKCVCSGDGAPYLHMLYSNQDSILYMVGEEKNFDAICAVDVASPKQLGRLGFLCGKIDFMIDHHKVGIPFADSYIEPYASAAGELIYKIYADLKDAVKILPIPEVSRRLYAAISADCGSFKYSNTTPDTHIIAANLVKEINEAEDEGMDTAEIARILHDRHTKNELTAQKLAIENLKFTLDGKLCYVVFTAEMMEKNGLCELDLGGIVDLPRSVEGVSVGLTLKQSRTDPNYYRISSRSNENVDVAKVCAQLDGGGHAKAAGAGIEAESTEKAVNTVVSLFEKAIIENRG